MPSRISSLAQRIVQDGRVDQNDVQQLKRLATQNNIFSREEKRVLGQLLQTHGDKFDAASREELAAFLEGRTPAPPTPPPARDLPDPAALNKHSGSVTWNEVAGGQLFVNGVSYDDVIQGQIANCYMVGAFSAIAYTDPKAIEDAIADNGDGTFTVRFFERQGYFGQQKEVKITIDGDLPQTASGASHYGKSRDSKELWVGLMEKAYAQWKGGYEAIGNGGRAGEVMEAITGRDDNYLYVNSSTADRLFETIRANAQNKVPMAAGTHGKDSGVDYTGTGVYAWHVYTVLGATVENGEKYVQLRNPWGRVEPGSDGKDDGIFKMKLADFARLYSGVYVN